MDALERLSDEVWTLLIFNLIKKLFLDVKTFAKARIFPFWTYWKWSTT